MTKTGLNSQESGQPLPLTLVTTTLVTALVTTLVTTTYYTRLCWNSGAIQSFLLQSATLLLFCAGAALHVTIEDRYDVERFVLKSLCLSFGM